MKICTVCNASKPLTSFYKKPGSKDGFSNQCKECMREKARARYSSPEYRDWHRKNAQQHRDNNREKYRKAGKKYYHSHKAEILHKKKTVHSLKVAARNELARAVKSGAITKPDKCPRCGSADQIEAHHADYSRPLDVRWLCNKCHAKLHTG